MLTLRESPAPLQVTGTRLGRAGLGLSGGSSKKHCPFLMPFLTHGASVACRRNFLCARGPEQRAGPRAAPWLSRTGVTVPQGARAPSVYRVAGL